MKMKKSIKKKQQINKEENKENLDITIKKEKNILTKLLKKIKKFFKRLQ